MCNEMVWCSTSDVFLDTCSVHLSDSEGIRNDPSGESVTASHFLKLLNGVLRLVNETNEVLGSMIGSYFGTQVINTSKYDSIAMILE